MTTAHTKPVRIGIRGAAGLLGSRLAAAIARTTDLRTTVGVVIPDRTLTGLLERTKLLPRLARWLPDQMYLQVPSHLGSERDMVRKFNQDYPQIHFCGASQLSWKNECDVVVDMAYPAGKEMVAQPYSTFPGNIILQDGASPEGRLIVPPFPAQGNGDRHFYRMGDCMMSGLIPMLYPFRDEIAKIRLHMLTQFDGREPDYLIHERAHAFYLREDLKEKLARDLSSLLPASHIEVGAVVQIPSLLHYQATITLELASEISGDEVRERLASTAHLRMIPERITSTYDINLARSFEDVVPSVMVFDHALYPRSGERSSTVRLVAALYYRSAAVLPNMDAIRILAQGMDPLEAMRQTDRDMGFSE
ncbi:MAG: hypothetical protein Q7S48_00085 [bacterium]|nr:hypothetical protein [bacterium]